MSLFLNFVLIHTMTLNWNNRRNKLPKFNSQRKFCNEQIKTTFPNGLLRFPIPSPLYNNNAQCNPKKGSREGDVYVILPSYEGREVVLIDSWLKQST